MNQAVFALEVPEIGSERESSNRLFQYIVGRKKKIKRRNISFSCGNVGWGIIFQAQKKAKA